MLKENDIFLEKYHIESVLGSGGFGEVYKAKDLRHNRSVAIKIDIARKNQVLLESKILSALQGGEGIPKLYESGRTDEISYMVIQLLGKNLGSVQKEYGGKFDIGTTVHIALQILSRLEYIHHKGYIHRDIKPQQFLLSLDEKSIYLVDFGLSQKYIYDNHHLAFQNHCSKVGNSTFASLNDHTGLRQSRRDDLESLGYMLVYMYKGILPWSSTYKVASANRWQQVLNIKSAITIPDLCQGCPQAFEAFIVYVRNLRFEENPDYSYLKSLLENIRNREKIPANYFVWHNQKEPKKPLRIKRKKSLTHIKLKEAPEIALQASDANINIAKEITKIAKHKRRSRTLIPIKIPDLSEDEASRTVTRGFRISTPKVNRHILSPTDASLVVFEENQNPIEENSYDVAIDQNNTPKSKMPEIKNRDILRKAKIVETEPEAIMITKKSSENCSIF
ncbi:unnamed protein product [Blepharisma stoltei]|uniref:Casein kinase I n=1 Tax=Blepharisma stoltei TaxID=1481888 RepID=A0AAU9IVY7_9CILI|nr:unnamed protein product [Blepharisma stoltei]